MRAKSEGVSLVSVYLLENPAIYDIFLVVVGTIITPSSPVNVHEGGHVHFTVTSNFVNDVRNKWNSDNPRVADIDPLSGRVVALREGKANIQFSDTIQYVSKVNVFKINKFLLEGPTPKISNYNSNLNYRSEYEIPFRVLSNDQEVKNLLTEGDPVNNNLVFECDVQPRGWVSVTPVIKSEEGRQIPVCVIRHILKYPENQVNLPTQTISYSLKSLSQVQSLSCQPSLPKRDVLTSPIVNHSYLISCQLSESLNLKINE